MYNKVILIGNITRDAEIRQVGQSQVATFTLATNERFKKADGTIEDRTEFHNVEFWGAPGVHPFLKKGEKLFIEGSIKTDKWTDQNNQNHSVTKIRASILKLLNPKPQPQALQAPYPPQGYPQQGYPQYQQGAPIPPQGYPGAPAPGYQQNYGPVAQPQRPPMQAPPTPPMPGAMPPGAPPMADTLDPNNYPDDLPPEFGPMP